MYSWKDRLKEWANQHPQALHWAITVGVVAIIAALLVTSLAVPPSTYETDKAAWEEDLVIAGAKIADIDRDVAGILALDLVTADDVGLISDAAAANQDSIGLLGNRLTTAEGNITTLCDDLAAIDASPPEAWLTGGFGNYTLHAECSESGNFTANVHLVYSRAWGCNGTYEECQEHFYAGINWTTGTPAYTTVVTFNGTAWSVSGLWWNVGKFPLVADNATALNITCTGLNSTWAPSYAYVEVWPVL